MQTLTLALLLVATSSILRADGLEPQLTKTNKLSLRLALATEDARQAKIGIETQTSDFPPKVIKSMEGVPTGSAEMALSGITNGDYVVYFSAPGYAAQWQVLTVKQGKLEPDTIKVKFFRKRYVVLRYAFNTSGARELSGKDIKEGRVAVAHWGHLPYFGQDWQIWQRSPGDEMFGDTPFLDFHRFSRGFGFAKVPKGAKFDDLNEAPMPTAYECMSTKAEKGLMLFCRVEADRKDGLGYGKVFVEDVTETPPEGIKVIESP